MILILVIAYVFVGPQDLPKVAKWLGRVVRRARALIFEIKKESGWDQLVNEADDINATIRDNKNAVEDALSSVKRDFNNVRSEFSRNINEAEQGLSNLKS